MWRDKIFTLALLVKVGDIVAVDAISPWVFALLVIRDRLLLPHLVVFGRGRPLLNYVEGWVFFGDCITFWYFKLFPNLLW